MKPFFTKMLNTLPVPLVAAVFVCVTVVALITTGLYHCFSSIGPSLDR